MSVGLSLPGTSRIDAGLIRDAGIVGGRAWGDTDGNGLFDGTETGFASVTVRLLDATSGTVLATATTSFSTATRGAYQFTIGAGTYVIEFVAPAGYGFSPADVGGDDTIDSDVTDTVLGRTDPIVVVGGTTDLTHFAGLVAQPAGVSGYVWSDLDGDGIQDPGEPGLPGVVVNLHGPNVSTGSLTSEAGPVLYTATTDTDGMYSISGVTPGQSYVLRRVIPVGFTSSPVDQDGDDSVDSDFPLPTSGTHAPSGIGITPTPGQTFDFDAGLIPVPDV